LPAENELISGWILAGHQAVKEKNSSIFLATTPTPMGELHRQARYSVSMRAPTVSYLNEKFLALTFFLFGLEFLVFYDYPSL